MRRSHLLTPALLSLTALTLLTACTSQPESLASSSPSQSATFPAVSGAAGAEPVIAPPTGTPPTELLTRDLIAGSGPAATAESTVTVNYVGVSWSDGAIFDSSWKRGTPAEFSLTQVITGWAQGLTGAQVGTRREIIIPPTLGYGETGQGAIKPNETLVFVVDILGVK
ncbi:unannotated protein [freshwater metagenome]|uniref:peptidylprolyl isomerase n=1 Tax=freshwater metagenome TaxID=449393 RepID=A0A6J7B957_9ZZZZ|nr:FKBP-type peptidylprolyl isomerase [Actinomycetota bacterium]MSY51182.1 FKBP-type peptidylprolyl isomerase [Actinomycetota bacterium]MSY87469.1 FKBP-type peptidylprolyl isomerase [Actinomycetota bacterium]